MEVYDWLRRWILDLTQLVLPDEQINFALPEATSRPCSKNIYIPFFVNHLYVRRIPPHARGVSRSSRHVERGMRWTLRWRSATCRADERYPADGEGVWSWHPWAGAKSVSMTCSRATVTKRSWTPGRARSISRKPSRREGRVAPVEPVVTNSCAFYYCARGCGCNQRPAFPAPSVFRRDVRMQDPDASAPRDCGRARVHSNSTAVHPD